VIDLHCHLLPGSMTARGNLQTALMMARAAVDQGVSHVAD
jgi:tyrosine-protein phosphatase YwqE